MYGAPHGDSLMGLNSRQKRAMTSRTNGDSESPFQGIRSHPASAALEHRRQEAVKRYFDGEPIERLCQEMGCSKSWLYKWKNRYQNYHASES